MSITTRVGLPAEAVATSDTSLLTPTSPTTRSAVSAFSLFNTSGSTATVSIYESPDSTSASGLLIATYVMTTLNSAQVVECIGQAYPVGLNIVAKSDITGAIAKITTTNYDGTS